MTRTATRRPRRLGRAPDTAWGKAFYRALRKGYDHGAAAHAADQAEARLLNASPRATRKQK